MKKNILITGALGFLGYNISKLLAENFPMYNIIGVDNEKDHKYINNKELLLKYNNFYYIQGDVLNKKLIRDIFLCKHSILNELSEIDGIDIVYTTAFESLLYDISTQGLEYYQNNILGTTNIAIEYILAKNRNKKLIYLSSCYVYGFTDSEKPFDEYSPLNPLSRNASIKLAVELLLRSLHETFNLPIIIARIPSFYGPGIHGDHLLNNIINAIVANKPIEIDFSEKSIINTIFYEDLIIGLESFIPFNATFNTFNMGGIDISLGNFTKIVNDIFSKLTGQKRGDNIIIFKNKIDKNCCISSNNVYKYVGWKNYTSVELGIEKTIKGILNAN